MIIKQLSQNEAASNGYTHEAIIQAADLASQTANNTALTLNIINPVNVGSVVKDVTAYLDTPFQNTADGAFNSTTFSVGDTASISTFMGGTPIQANANGSFVTNSGPSSTVGSYNATASSLTVTFNAMSGKPLSALNAGVLRVLFRLVAIPIIAKGGV